MTKRPINTTAEMASNPMLGLVTAMAGGIEASEARGQRELVASESLPTSFNCYGNKETEARYQKVLEGWGFKFGEPFADDPMFRPAELPPGWTKEGSDHAMWSHVKDDKGRERVSIFYKAAFYDRRAFMDLSPRYVIDYTVVEEHQDILKQVCCNKVVDRQTGETLKEFTSTYRESAAAARAFFNELSDNPGDPEHWTSIDRPTAK